VYGIGLRPTGEGPSGYPASLPKTPGPILDCGYRPSAKSQVGSRGSNSVSNRKSSATWGIIPSVPLSQNGWPVLLTPDTARWDLGPALPSLRLAPGPPGFVLCHWALWFHERIEALGGRVLDDWGYAYRPIRGTSNTWSNHASGTAIDLNAQLHPLGDRHTFQPTKSRAIRTRLAGRYAGKIVWGGDYLHRADEMHFELGCGPAEARALADRLRDSPRGRRLVARNPQVTRW
jgi:hypothetical protein